MKLQRIEVNEERGVFLQAYLLESGETFRNKGSFPAIIVMPGGGFTVIAQSEAEPPALAFCKSGFSVFVLNYSVDHFGQRPGNGNWPNPVEDYEKAISIILDNAQKYEIDPERIAVCGFSAGACVAAAAATVAQVKPKAAILGYGRLCSLVDEKNQGQVQGVAHKLPNATVPDLSETIGADTPPCFIFATANDNVVLAENSLKFAQVLAQKGISYELHIYSEGPHAFSTGDKALGVGNACPRIGNWVNEAVEWLRERM